MNGPDGGPHAGGSTNIDSFSGVSGVIHTGATMFVVGVFTDGTNPTDPAPARLDFSAGATAFTELSPLLDQTFFIGDGLTGTGSGTVQEFHVPTNATTLFLGFADGLSFAGTPNFYGDNIGTLVATFAIAARRSVPEPTILALLGGSLLCLATVRRHPGPGAERGSVAARGEEPTASETYSTTGGQTSVVRPTATSMRSSSDVPA